MGPLFGLGSDFIGIEYGEKAVNVSPKDADGFVDTVCAGTELRIGTGRRALREERSAGVTR